jgi:hypothetical protein
MTAPSSCFPAVGSDRVRLARQAHDAALQVLGVAGLEAGPLGLVLTADENQRVDGVRCVATGDGSFEVTLRLRCELVPLLELADIVKASVVRAAGSAGIAVTDVTVLIADIVDPGLARWS